MDIQNFWQKNNKKIILILALVMLVFTGHFVFSKVEKKDAKKPNSLVAKEAPTPQKQSSPESSQNELLKEQIGQMLILGFRGTKFQENSFIDKSIKNLKIGGIILFDYDSPSKMFPRNIINKEQTKSLVANLQKNSATPLFISIDVEGGLVNRLKPKYGFME
ncbi:MAG: glycoside hydrolase family 3 N-terminal domain-containing protein, partial [Patescibacteria group bacterium]